MSSLCLRPNHHSTRNPHVGQLPSAHLEFTSSNFSLFRNNLRQATQLSYLEGIEIISRILFYFTRSFNICTASIVWASGSLLSTSLNTSSFTLLIIMSNIDMAPCDQCLLHSHLHSPRAVIMNRHPSSFPMVCVVMYVVMLLGFFPHVTS